MIKASAASSPVKPPKPYLEIQAHTAGEGVSFIAKLAEINVEPSELYVAKAWLYIPGNTSLLSGKFIVENSLPQEIELANPNTTNQWQHIKTVVKSTNVSGSITAKLFIELEKPGEFYTAGLQFNKIYNPLSAEPLSGFRYNRRQSYRVVKLDDLLNSGNASVAKKVQALPVTKLQVAPVMFGNRETPEFPCAEYPAGWNPGVIEVPSINIYTLKGAIVHGETGLVTIGDMLVRESLKLPSYDHFDIKWIGPDLMSLPYGKPVLNVGKGAHIFCGYPGTRNYSHFLMDIICAALVPPLNAGYENSTILAPRLYKRFQEEYLNFFPEFKDSAIFLQDHNQVYCDQLSISTFSMINSHHFPHPYQHTVASYLADRMSSDLDAPAESFPKKIYLNRLDAPSRKLLNESEVIECVESFGFVSISLTGRKLAEQVALIRNATHIVAPHGAGCTNLLFCRPHTKFLELHCDTYVQWSMRRIGSLIPVVYGCVIGRQQNDDTQTWRKQWTLDIDQLRAALGEMHD